MTDWLSIAEAAALTGLPEDRLRGAIVLGRLRAEPTGNLADYRVRRDELARFAREEGVTLASDEPAKPCCGARLLLPSLAVLVILGGLLVAVGASSFLHCSSRRPAVVPVVAPTPESELHARFDRLTANWPDDLSAVEEARRAAMIEEWEAFAADVERSDASGRDLMLHVAERNIEALSSAPRR